LLVRARSQCLFMRRLHFVHSVPLIVFRLTSLVPALSQAKEVKQMMGDKCSKMCGSDLGPGLGCETTVNIPKLGEVFDGDKRDNNGKIGVGFNLHFESDSVFTFLVRFNTTTAKGAKTTFEIPFTSDLSTTSKHNTWSQCLPFPLGVLKLEVCVQFKIRSSQVSGAYGRVTGDCKVQIKASAVIPWINVPLSPGQEFYEAILAEDQEIVECSRTPSEYAYFVMYWFMFGFAVFFCLVVVVEVVVGAGRCGCCKCAPRFLGAATAMHRLFWIYVFSLPCKGLACCGRRCSDLGEGMANKGAPARQAAETELRGARY